MARFSKITVEAVVQSFPTHGIERIEHRPVYATLKPMLKGLRKCAEAIPSTQKNGHAYLVLDDADFFALKKEAKRTPKQPKLNPDIDAKATQFVIAEKNRQHDRDEEEWHMHLTVSEALKRMVTENIDKMYLVDIEVEDKSVLELIDYLKRRYFKITTMEITQNDKKYRRFWDPDVPIE